MREADNRIVDDIEYVHGKLMNEVSILAKAQISLDLFSLPTNYVNKSSSVVFKAAGLHSAGIYENYIRKTAKQEHIEAASSLMASENGSENGSMEDG